jgi:hypothetical protein
MGLLTSCRRTWTDGEYFILGLRVRGAERDRKSQLPQLESELALLEAQIKAAEARLARVQATQSQVGATKQG